VQHPEHTRDAARAVAWTVKHAARYGGSPDQVFVSGHSAGGHLAALLTTDEKYLKDEGLTLRAVKGVIAIGGVYRVPEVSARFRSGEGAVEFGIQAPDLGSFSLRIRKAPDRPEDRGGLDLTLSPLNLVFGNDPAVRRQASPLTHVRPGLPPVLILYAEREIPTLPTMAEEYAAALRAHKVPVDVRRIDGRTHNSILFAATSADDPAIRAIVEFIRRNAAAAHPKES
jgi:acetyl esterase/lipase